MVDDIVDDHTAVDAGICGDLTHGFFQSAHNDDSTRLLVAFQRIHQFFDVGDSRQKSHSAAGDNTFLNCGTGSRQSVFYAQFLFLHLHFRSSAHVDYGNAAGKFCKAFGKFFLVVFGSSHFHLSADGFYSVLDLLRIAAALDNGSVVLVDFYLFCFAQHIERNVLKLNAHFFAHYGTARKNGDIFEHFLSSVAESGSFYRHHAERAAQFVDDQRR